MDIGPKAGHHRSFARTRGHRSEDLCFEGGKFRFNLIRVAHKRFLHSFAKAVSLFALCLRHRGAQALIIRGWLSKTARNGLFDFVGVHVEIKP